MRIQTGNPVRGHDFFARENLIDKAWDLIAAGNHIMIAAPRRVGKTSLMYYLMDHPQENYHFLYIITQSVNNENEFFRRMVNKVLKTDYIQKSQRLLTFLEKHKPIIKKVAPDGIEFGVSEDHNYLEMLIRILKSFHPDSKKLVIMIDEFPEALENIIKDDSESAAIRLLQSNRELRHDPEICENVQFIYTGSIGLETVVSGLNAVSAINDLSRLKIPPLTIDEAKQMIGLLLENVQFDLSVQIIEYIIQKIEWLIPFYIQLVMQELKNIHRDGYQIQITEATVDQAFSEMLEQRNHFEHWHTRLRTSFKSGEYNFVKELLNVTSENEKINSNEIFNLAVKYQLEAICKSLVDSLVYDGYINNNDDNKIYRYNSPILRMWWRKNVAS